MSGQTPQPTSRRGNHGRPRSANEPSKGKGSDQMAGKALKEKHVNEKTSETTGKSETAKPQRVKPQNEGEKLVIRRLPPAMTEAEFMSILGPEWEAGQGRVDWFSYSQGKVSKDPSKPSRPSRAYVHVTRKDDIMPLSEAVRSKTWEDAKGTFNDASLISAPVVEFSIYKKVPSSKKRMDTRQGTIDQDPEFMAFLESLANPTQPRDIEADEEDSAKPEVKVTTTPLLEYLKNNKPTKGKDSKKNSKSNQADGGKGKGGAKEEESSKKKGKASKDDKPSKPKETVKILTKKAATEQAAEAAKNAANQISAPGNSDAPKSRRAGIAAAARILQRDLGLSPGSAHRKARQDAAKADAEAKTEGKSSSNMDTATANNGGSSRPASPAPSDHGAQGAKTSGSTTNKSQSGRRNRGGKNPDKGKQSEPASTQPTAQNPPVILKKKPDANQKPVAPAPAEGANVSAAPKASQNAPKSTGKQAQGQKKAAPITPDATRAFVKHVNVSQGVTEAALREALGAFGTVSMVDIDKRKGFAFVDFAEHDSLVKAISASPVSVGQASVQILERKEKKPQAQGTAVAAAASEAGSSTEKTEKGSGRSRRGRGGGGVKNTANEKNQNAATSTSNIDTANGG